MKKTAFITAIILAFFSMIDSVFACTSFAVYSNHVYYGMNLDFADTVMKLLITSNGDMKTFHLAFERVMGDIPFFAKTAGMNTKGLFAACQEQYPIDETTKEFTDGDLFIFQLYDKIDDVTDVDQIESITGKTNIINVPGLNLHNLFADVSGKAIVTESNVNGNAVTRKDGKFMVMTNFPNYTMDGKTYAEAEGKGSDRYKICHEYLNRTKDQFTIDNGFELLETAFNHEPENPTRCSMVFDPQNSDVYLAFFGDFNKTLKVSIKNSSIEAWKGYGNNHYPSLTVNEDGIMVSDVINHFG